MSENTEKKQEKKENRIALVVFVGILFVLAFVVSNAVEQIGKQRIQKAFDEYKMTETDFDSYKHDMDLGYVDAEGNITEASQKKYPYVMKLTVTPTPTPTATPTPTPEGSVHVTFAENKFLDIAYFEDENLVNPIDTEDCYLYPGDCIYASEPICNSYYSSMYCFSEYRIYEYTNKNQKNEVYWTSETDGKGSFVLQIPENYRGTELSIVPTGRYTDRELSLNDYYYDIYGTEHKLLGTWKINNNDYSVEKIAISPLISYQVSYHFGPEYYFVSSIPKALYWQDSSDLEDGFVAFENMSSDSDVMDFSVELKRYRNAVIYDADNGIIDVNINNVSVDNLKQSKDILIEKLKPGDVVKIVTANNFNLTSSQVNVQVSNNVNGGYSYSFLIPEDKETLNLYVKEWKTKKVPVSINNTDKTFEVLEYIRIGNKQYTYEELLKKSSLEVREDETVKISVPADIPENIEVQVRVGNDEPVKFSADSEAFMLEYAYNEIDEIRITQVEKANTSYPTNLLVTVDKSMGYACISVLTENINVKDYTYTKDTKGVLCNQNAGSAKNIEISMNNISMELEKEIKMEITKIKKDGTKIKSIQYVKGTVVSESITIQDNNVYYESIEVKISKAEVAYYKAPVISKATVTVSQSENGKKLSDGDVLEASSKVIIVIKPDLGYYISGNSTLVNNCFEKEIKFSDLEKTFKDFKNNHSVKRLINVYLDRKDYYGYGTISFLINGKETFLEKVALKESDKLEMKYVIPKDSEYQIVAGFFEQNKVNREGKTIVIPVVQSLEGTYIKITNYPEDFIVEKKGD